MQFIGKNSLRLKRKFLVLLSFSFLVLIVIRLPYINLLFPLWVIIVLSFAIIYTLFRLPFTIRGIILIGLWILALLFVLLDQELISEHITVAVVILFAGNVVGQFLKGKSIFP